jgi:hypothetical protein
MGGGDLAPGAHLSPRLQPGTPGSTQPSCPQPRGADYRPLVGDDHADALRSLAALVESDLGEMLTTTAPATPAADSRSIAA